MQKGPQQGEKVGSRSIINYTNNTIPFVPPQFHKRHACVPLVSLVCQKKGKETSPQKPGLDPAELLLVRLDAVTSFAVVVLVVMGDDGLANHLLKHRGRDLGRIIRVLVAGQGRADARS